MTQRIGFIGLGLMGKPMARNLMKAGFPVTIYARHPETVQDLVAEDATLVESSRAVGAASDVVITMLPNSPEVEEVVLGPAGVLESARSGLIIIDMSTIAPEASRSLERRCAEQGVTFLDAPVSGGSNGAEAGTLAIMVGGEQQAFERCRPIFEAMGGKEKIFYVGPSGAGEVVKLANNVLCGVIAAGTAEALVMGVKAGVSTEMLAKIIGVSSGGSTQLNAVFPIRVFNGSFEPGFMTDLLWKDLGLALDLGAQNSTPLELTALTRALFERTREAGYGRADYTAFTKLLEEQAGVQVRTQQER
ncbi:MAG TPA: NAD(P)-binding domain-containing protein [Ktedonobacterales bacterium]|nr:NAD(P)-binding domain-containing protein [Ktedonobacterales bacterium]